jgi:hypothetical protein
MRIRRIIVLILAVVLLLVFAVVVLLFRKGPSPQRVPIADGRIIQIEAVSFGTNHQVGVRSPMLDRFGPWLPSGMRQALEPKVPHSRVRTPHAALVLWINAVDTAGKSVDSQAVRVEFVDEHGELFGEQDRHWFGFGNFSRVAHVFHTYPRQQKKLELRLTPWRTNQGSLTTIVNPRVHTAAAWAGRTLPNAERVGNLEIVLRDLIVRTNDQTYWQTPTRYWEPVWELRQNGTAAFGWDAPEWAAEDPTGNRGKYLGLHHPVLRYSATFYPGATNLDFAQLVARLPQTAVSAMQSNIFWNTKHALGTTEVFALGILPAGVNVFTEGAHTTARTMTAVRGGAPSGWTSQSQRVTPLKQQHWYGHYTPVPVLYLKAPSLPPDTRIGVRLVDEQGRYWLAKPEPQGVRDGIRPFLIELPDQTQSVTPEVVILKPVQATFQVQTPQKAR